jgi:hypothetical protein
LLFSVKIKHKLFYDNFELISFCIRSVDRMYKQQVYDNSQFHIKIYEFIDCAMGLFTHFLGLAVSTCYGFHLQQTFC